MSSAARVISHQPVPSWRVDQESLIETRLDAVKRLNTCIFRQRYAVSTYLLEERHHVRRLQRPALFCERGARERVSRRGDRRREPLLRHRIAWDHTDIRVEGHGFAWNRLTHHDH